MRAPPRTRRNSITLDSLRWAAELRPPPRSGLVEPSICILNHLLIDSAICRHISRCRCISPSAFHDPILDPQPLAISKSGLPQLLRLPPDCAQPLRALAQIGLVVRDGHVHDIVVLPPGLSGAV